MLPACFTLADEVFPRVRAEAARRLVADGWSQTRTAKALGVSQAMVSKYQPRPADDDPLVLRLADATVASCHAPADAATGTASWCDALGVEPKRDSTLRDLLAAERRLLAAAPVSLAPQIGINLVVAGHAATQPQQILGYPGRIVRAGDRLVPPTPPAWGASGHLARCLLSLRETDPSVGALASIRGGSAVCEVAEAMAPVAEMTGDDDRDGLFHAAVAHAPAGAFTHDPGGFGIEPCLYIPGPDAESVVAKILAIHQKMETSS